MTGNLLRLAGKILVLVKLMALTIYAKAGLLRPRTCSHKAKFTNYGLKTNITAFQYVYKHCWTKWVFVFLSVSIMLPAVCTATWMLLEVSGKVVEIWCGLESGHPVLTVPEEHTVDAQRLTNLWKSHGLSTLRIWLISERIRGVSLAMMCYINRHWHWHIRSQLSELVSLHWEAYHRSEIALGPVTVTPVPILYRV